MMISLLKSLMSINDLDQLYDWETTIFNRLPFHFYWKDKKGKYLGCNDAQAKTTGYAKGSDFVGFSDFDFCWAKYAPALRAVDTFVMRKDTAKTAFEGTHTIEGKDINVLSYKVPLYTRRKNVIGIIGVSFILEEDNDIMQSLQSLSASKFSAVINTGSGEITSRQADCLYYLVKGMTAKQIGKVLSLSPRTVEHYIDILKSKFACYSRADLISLALTLPYIKKRLLLDI